MTQETRTHTLSSAGKQSAMWKKPCSNLVVLIEHSSMLSNEFTTKSFYDFKRKQMTEVKEATSSSHAPIQTIETIPFINLPTKIEDKSTSIDVRNFQNFQKAKNLFKNN